MNSNHLDHAVSSLVHLLASTPPAQTYTVKGGGEMRLYRGPYRQGEHNGAFILYAPTGDWGGELHWLYSTEWEDTQEYFDVYCDHAEMHDWTVTTEWIPACV